MAADEATGAGDDHEIILGHCIGLSIEERGVYLTFQRLATLRRRMLHGHGGGRAGRLRDGDAQRQATEVHRFQFVTVAAGKPAKAVVRPNFSFYTSHIAPFFDCQARARRHHPRHPDLQRSGEYRPVPRAPDVGRRRSWSSTAARPTRRWPSPAASPMSAVVHRPFDTHAEQWRFAVDETGITSDWILRLDADYMVEPALRDEIAALAPAPDDRGLPDRLHLLHRRQAAARLALSRAAGPVPPRPRAASSQTATPRSSDRRAGRALANRLLHDDRKSLERWLQSQSRYQAQRGREARDTAVVGAELGRSPALHARAGAARRRGALPVGEGIDIRRHGRASLYRPARDRRPDPLHASAAPRPRHGSGARRQMTYVLGLNAYHADAAACLVKDGDLVAAVEEERFRRIKHWGGFPSESIRYCLAEAGISLGDVDARRGQQRQPRQSLAQACLCADLGRRPGLRAEATAPSRRSRRCRRQPQAAPARPGVPRHRACRRASSLPSRLGLPGVALRQGGGGVGRRLRRFLLGRLGPGRRAARSRSTAASTSRIRSACSTRR